MKAFITDYAPMPSPAPKHFTVKVERKGVTYKVLLSDCCGRPYIVSTVRRERPTRGQRETGGKLRQEIEAVAVAKVEAWLDERA